jgi:hypothetical protein
VGSTNQKGITGVVRETNRFLGHNDYKQPTQEAITPRPNLTCGEVHHESRAVSVQKILARANPEVVMCGVGVVWAVCAGCVACVVCVVRVVSVVCEVCVWVVWVVWAVEVV